MTVQRDFLRVATLPSDHALCDHSTLGMRWQSGTQKNNNSSAHHLLPDGKQTNQVSESEHILIRFFK